MKNIEKNLFPQKSETEQEQKARLISRYIEKHIIGANKGIGGEEEMEIKKYYDSMSPREKSDILYSKIMAFMADKQAEIKMKEEMKNKNEEFLSVEPDPYLISEINVLFDDERVKKIIPETYGEARIDAEKNRLSDFGNLWYKVSEEIAQKEKIYKQLERQIHLNEISGQGKISSAKSRMSLLAENLTDLEKRKKNLEVLQGFIKTAENTDIVANFQYENFKEYKKQLDNGFVWLPSRKKIHQETISAILNHRWPVLIGEAGSGKSDQADAAAIELTGHLPTEVECESTTGETQLIKDASIDSSTGGSYEKYGPLMSAFTGFDDSRQDKPTVSVGRIVRFDESGRLGPKAYSIIKKARQKKEGDDFYERKVLPGASAIWTSNPVGPRYPDRHSPDPAMRRELAEIEVKYPDMSDENPELYEFALVALFDKNNYIAAAKVELGPAYEEKEIPENKREILKDGGVIVAEDEIIKNMADARHGALWRFCGAIKSLQDSFVYGNAEVEKYPDTLLRFKEDADGNIAITSDGSGEPLIISTSTVTLGELASWMKGFNERMQKQDKEFRVKTLTEWIDFKINTYLKQADKADKEKIKAIFKHFHFLENSVPDISQAKPMTPKEIGYLSPRVPRPVHIEKTEDEMLAEKIREEEKRKQAEEAKKYETRQVLLEDGSKILIKEEEFIFGDNVLIRQGDKFTLPNGESFFFAGIADDEASEHNSKTVGQLASGEKLYKIFNSPELRLGIMNEFNNLTGETGVENFKKEIIDFWKSEGCEKEFDEFKF